MKESVDALTFARDMPADTADTFVGMYVNDLTLDLGVRGKRGIEIASNR